MTILAATIAAYHFLRDDMTTGRGNEPPWTIGESRTIVGELIMCERGYHSSPRWHDALQYAPGNVACKVLVSEPQIKDYDKWVSHRRILVAAINADRMLRLWACDCADRMLRQERKHGREPDKRSWDAVAVARRYIDGEATKDDLAAAWAAACSAAAWAAAANAAAAAAWAAARNAAEGAAAWAAAAGNAAANAAAAWWVTEVTWQRQHLDEIMEAAFAEAEAPKAARI